MKRCGRETPRTNTRIHTHTYTVRHQGSRQSDMPWRCASFVLYPPPFKSENAMLQSASATIISMHTQILTYAHSTHPEGRRWLCVHGMQSVITDPLSDVVHSRNGDSSANIVTKLAEKTDTEMPGKHDSVEHPLYSRSGYNHGQTYSQTHEATHTQKIKMK